MAKEIERKFLVKDSSYRLLSTGSIDITQAYLCSDPDSTVRIRLSGDRAFLTVKTRNSGVVRNEWEFEIDTEAAKEMLNECRSGRIEKTRFFVPADGEANHLTWEIDEFHGRLQGLVIAEIELPAPDTRFAIPPFIGEEVTGNQQYYNSVLAATD